MVGFVHCLPRENYQPGVDPVAGNAWRMRRLCEAVQERFGSTRQPRRDSRRSYQGIQLRRGAPIHPSTDGGSTSHNHDYRGSTTMSNITNGIGFLPSGVTRNP